tara:strand:- start:2517 stop:2702 length:186 start_codon:yes stop_codon:yes gene_type:complete
MAVAPRKQPKTAQTQGIQRAIVTDFVVIGQADDAMSRPRAYLAKDPLPLIWPTRRQWRQRL